MSSDLAAAIISVPVSLACAAAGLSLFKLSYTLLTRFVGIILSLPVLGDLLKTPLAIILGAFESSLGPAAKFVPTSTHFFLAAVVAAFAEPRVALPALPFKLPALLGGGGRARRGAATPSRRR